jgi:hypothetical protein
MSEDGTDDGVAEMTGWHRFAVDATGLKGKRLRVLTDLPTDDAAVPQDQLARGITDVITDDDEVSVNLTVRVYPVGEPIIRPPVTARADTKGLHVRGMRALRVCSRE